MYPGSPPQESAQTLCDLLDEQFRLRPDATAVRTVEQTWTYADLDRLSARLAYRLQRRGAGPGRVVGLLAPRSPAALIGIVATLRAGAACLPLDVDDPPRRNQEVLEEVGVEQVLAAAPIHWLPDVQLIDDPSLADEEVTPLRRPSPLDLAYAITTSGSTGRPKIVGVPHEGILNAVVACVEDLDLVRPDDVMLWTLAPTVDSSMHDLLMPLAYGACVAIPEHQQDLPAGRMVHAVRALGATVLEVPAAVLGPYGRSLLPRLAEAGVRLVITGGSQLDGPGLGDIGSLVVCNGYGPTEASVAATWYRCGASTPSWVPIGRTLRGVRTYVLDDDLNPVPDGVDGQMFIAGVGLARGYLGLPGRTAGVFLPDPFSPEPGQRMYATGDRVRRQPEGDYVYVGRIDDQIKISGFRVEIGEVEHALRDCTDVADVAVTLRPDAPGGAALVAFLVGDRSSDEAIKDQLGDRLPGHMIPRIYVWLEELPLNRPGKVDRKALARMPLEQLVGPRDSKLL